MWRRCKMTVQDDIRHVFTKYNKSYPAKDRVSFYVDKAKEKLIELNHPIDRFKLSENDWDSLPSEIQELYWLQTYAKSAIKSLDAGDVDQFAQSFERVVTARIISGLPKYEKFVTRSEQSRKGKKKIGREGALKIRMRDLVKIHPVSQIEIISELETLAEDGDDTIVKVDRAINKVTYFNGIVEKTIGFNHIYNVLTEINSN